MFLTNVITVLQVITGDCWESVASFPVAKDSEEDLLRNFLEELLFEKMSCRWMILITDSNTDFVSDFLRSAIDRGASVSSFTFSGSDKGQMSLDLNYVTQVISSWVMNTSSLHIVIKCTRNRTAALLRTLQRQSLLCSSHVHWVTLISDSEHVAEVWESREVNLTLVTPAGDSGQWLDVYRVRHDSTTNQFKASLSSRWSSRTGFVGSVSLLGDQGMKTSFEGRKIKITLERHFPFFIPPAANQTQPIGVDIDFLDMVRRALNFSYVIIRPEDGKWGSLKNGTWNGMIGMVHRQEVEAALGGMTITVARAEATSFATPYAYDRTTFVSRAPSEVTKVWVILRPLQLEVWLAIASMAVLVAIIIATAEKWTGEYYTRGQSKTKCRHVTLADAIIYTYRSFLYQECYNPDHVSTRVLVVSWWIFVITLVAGYNGHLVSFMTNPGLVDAMDTIAKLVAAIQAGKFTCGTIKDSSDHNIFKMGDSDNFATILRSMESDPENFVHRDVEGLARVLKMNYVYIAGQLTVDADIKNAELFRFAKDSFQISGYGVALVKGSWHVEAMNRVILRLREFGLVEKWIRTHIESIRHSGSPSEDLERKLSVADVQGAFVLLFMGLVLSSMAAGGEILFCHLQRRQSANKNTKSPDRKPCQQSNEEKIRPIVFKGGWINKF